MISNIMQIQSLTIGKQGENGAEVLVFDLSEFVTRWGAGTATLLHKRPKDNRPYLVSGVVQSSTANTLTWTVSNADTAQAGEGSLEIRWTITNGTAKSAKFKTIIIDALVDETTETPGAVVYMADGSQITTNKNDIAQIKEDIGALDDLTTTDKSNLVAAINEAAASGGTGGTTNYNALSNRPQINGTTLTGNKSSADLSLASASHSHAQSDITGLADALAGKAASSHTHTATQVSGLATVATSGSYNDLLNKPSIPAATTVTQTLTSGTEIGAVNGTKLYAPAGGGSGGGEVWRKINSVQITEDTSLFDFTTDSDGNPFSLKKARVFYSWTKGTSETLTMSTYMFHRINGISSGVDSPAGYTSTWFAPSKSATPAGVITVSEYDGVEFVESYGTGNTTVTPTSAMSGNALANIKTVTGRQLSSSRTITSIGCSNSYIPAGSYLELWGVDA